MREYVGHESQLYGVEEHRLCGGKGDGIRLFEINNGRGLMMTISADRCGDISRLYYKGNNLCFFAPCGYVAPTFYDNKGVGFLKSFTAGFLTTCGLTAVGEPCTDDGQALPLHGTISHVPAERVNHWIDDEGIHMEISVLEASLFGHKLLLERSYTVPTDRDEIIIKDTVKNIGCEKTPYMILYHFNMGYPLLSENAVVTINSDHVSGISEEAEKHIDTALIMEKPQANFAEQCFSHHVVDGVAKIYNPDIKTSLSIHYNTEELPCFTEWKMMGEYDYALGLEPGNCTPEGRAVMRERGQLDFIEPGKEKTQTIVIKLKNE